MVKEALLDVLKEYFGYTEFRPLQQEIILDTLAGRDVFALLPTGGGKSLCFQLPALLRPGLTVVVSPLIALMKDQVDALQASGVAATYLNSSLDADQARSRLRGLHQGEYRLLYVAPERLMLSGFLADLQKWNVNLIAVDEAHCISAWGHDFRPEYRNIAQVRAQFPNVPVMALTATATGRVREDIVNLLKLKDAGCYVASFNRPNLSYRVVPKNSAYDQTLAFIKKRPQESGIVYCLSRKGAEGLASNLCADGIKAKPYHAGLEPSQRSKNQELFLRDEARVICATIAFGMGINKPNVRFVIHYDLPKNIESYYQETGRAGRDGLPSDCLLLFSAGDMVKQTRFIDEMSNPDEQEYARQQLRKMAQYSETASCRRAVLLDYFGEKWPLENCNGCDNCNTPRDTYDGTLQAQKFMSCVYRIHERSAAFGASIPYIADVLTGKSAAIMESWGHQNLSTFGIGKELKKAEWQAIGRELIRLRLLTEKQDGKFTRIQLSSEGRVALTQRKPIQLTRAPISVEDDDEPKSGKKRSAKEGEIACDEALFDKLRDLRKKLADERNVPAYIVFSDVSLRQMASNYPQSGDDLRRISGVGEKKHAEFGAAFLKEIADHLQGSAKLSFPENEGRPAPAVFVPRRPKVTDTIRETLRLFRDGQSPESISAERGLVAGTIYGHLADAIEAGEPIEISQIATPQQQDRISEEFKKIGFANLTGIQEALGDGYNYGQIKVMRAHILKTLGK